MPPLSSNCWSKTTSKGVCRASGRQDKGLPKASTSYSLEPLIPSVNSPLPCNVTYTQVLDSQVANHPTLKEEDYPGLSRWAQCHHKGPFTWKRKAEAHQSEAPWERLDQPLLAWEMEEGTHTKACRQPLETGEDKEVGSLLDPPERNVAMLTPWF